MKNFAKVCLVVVMIFAPCHVGSFSLSIDSFGEPEEDECSLPPETGMCKDIFFKYFYNSSAEKCDIFIYGGCGGNRNNFENEEDCMEHCQAKVHNCGSLDLNLNNILDVKDDCDYPKDKGPCRATHKRYYFNGEVCERFDYGGCGGNLNNFLSKEECMEKCGSRTDTGSGESEDDLFSFGLF